VRGTILPFWQASIYLFSTTDTNWLPTLQLASKEHSNTAVRDTQVDRWKPLRKGISGKLLPVLAIDEIL